MLRTPTDQLREQFKRDAERDVRETARRIEAQEAKVARETETLQELYAELAEDYALLHRYE